MPWIKSYVNSGIDGTRQEDRTWVDDAEWSAMSEEEKNQILEDFASAHMNNCIDSGAYVEDDEAKATEDRSQ